MKGRFFAGAVAIVCAFAACDDNSGGRHIGDGSVDHIEIMPADASVTVIDRAAVTQDYTAMLVHADGTKEDVTSTAVFSLGDAAYGTFAGTTATITGGGAGVVQVTALSGSITGTTTLTVNVKLEVRGSGVGSADPLPDFDSATEDASLAPTIVYPSDHILVPPNLGKFDVHWANNPATNTANYFRSEISNQYIDVKLYTTGLTPPNNEPFWDQYAPDAWFPIASSKQQLTLSVAAMNTADPTKKGTSASQHVDVTNENARGGIYYWTSSGVAGGPGIWRYDIAAPDVPPAPFFEPMNRPSQCMGCHALSRDGSRIAMTLDGGGGRGSVWDVGSLAELGTPTYYWDFSTFNLAADKVVTIENGSSGTTSSGTMLLRNAADSSVISTIPAMTAGFLSTEPEISPDNTLLANVEYSQAIAGTYDLADASIVIRSYDDATGMFGAPRSLVAGDATDGYNAYPSFSPDSQWVLYTKVDTGGSYNNPNAETWVVKVDGTSAIKLDAANTSQPGYTNSWPRWVPFAQSFGPNNETMFYLTFSSTRPYGVRIPGGGHPQIWMTPFFPDRAAQGMDPTGPAFRVPFQDVATNNHIAQWTNQVVIQRDKDGKLFTASDLQASMRAMKKAVAAFTNH